MAKLSLKALQREHLEKVLGLTANEAGKFSYNDLLYRYSLLEDTPGVYPSTAIEGLSPSELDSLGSGGGLGSITQHEINAQFGNTETDYVSIIEAGLA